MLTTFHQSSTQRSTTGRNVFSLFRMITHAPGSCPCCDGLLVTPSLHAVVEDQPLVSRASKGGLTLALRQVAVTIFVNRRLGGVAQSWGLLTYWRLNDRGLLNDWWLDDRGRLDDWRLLGGASCCQ